MDITSREQWGEWLLSPYLSDIRQFEQTHRINRYHAQILANRGILSPEEMRQWLQVQYSDLRDPLRMIETARAVERIWQAITSGETITVYGDYDADGICSSAILFLALKKITNAPVLVHIPNRFKEPRGLHREAIEALHQKGTKLIVTTDSGSSDSDALSYAASLGITVIVTDHHEVPSPMPDGAYALVNPHRLDGEVEDHVLCGSGVAFKVVQALYRRSGSLLTEADEQEFLSLVAIGTLADVVPLVGDNHILVRLGLLHLQRTQNVGLQALLRVASIRQEEPIAERSVGFYVAPRLNAAARMEDPMTAFTLLTSTQEEEANLLVGKLEQLNQQRQAETEHLSHLALQQAEAQKHLPILLVGDEGWHQGIVGLIAGKLLEKYARPVIVLSKDPQTGICHGSARSTAGFHLVEALRSFQHPFLQVGGHARAAGFTIAEQEIEPLHQHLITCWMNLFPLWPLNSPPAGEEKRIDLELASAKTLTPAFFDLLQRAGPYGHGFTEPVFLLRKLRLSKVSDTRYGTHFLSLSSPDRQWQGTGKIASGHSHLLEGLRSKETWVSIVFSLQAPRSLEEGPMLQVLHLERYQQESPPLID